MKRVLVTGATGFCGRHLCAHLAQNGYEVIGTSHARAMAEGLEGTRLEPLDITSHERVLDLVREIRPDFICHLAAQSAPRLSWDQMEKTFEINVAGTVNLLDAARQFAPESRFLFTSSSQVYGKTFKNKPLVCERDLLLPETPYAASKAVAEYACINFVRQFGLEVVIARAFNHVGTGQPVHLVFSDWCRQIALAERGQGPAVLEVGNVEVSREFLHVRDVVCAYAILMEKGAAGQVYNISSGRCVKLGGLLDHLLSKAAVAITVQSVRKKFRRDDAPAVMGDAGLMRALGWEPAGSVHAAIDELLDWWRQRVRTKAYG